MFGRAAAFCAWYMLEPLLVDMAVHCCDPLLALDSVQVHSVMDVVHGRVFSLCEALSCCAQRRLF